MGSNHVSATRGAEVSYTRVMKTNAAMYCGSLRLERQTEPHGMYEKQLMMCMRSGAKHALNRYMHPLPRWQEDQACSRQPQDGPSGTLVVEVSCEACAPVGFNVSLVSTRTLS